MRYNFILLTCILVFCSCSEGVTYLDDDYPGLVPKKYAKGLVNVEGRFQQNLTMSPDGSEQLFTITGSALWRYERILRVRKTSKETLIDTPRFVQDFEYENEWFIGEAMISPDNEKLYFVADYPPDLWQATRSETGEWIDLQKMAAINTEIDDWYPSLAANGNLYFTNGTLYKSEPVPEGYMSKTSIQIPMDQADIRDSAISPNEDFLIFAATDSTNDNSSDLYISFKDEQGQWTHAQNLGKRINTEALEFAPYISPDGQFLFFSRRERWQHAGYSNIYWVSMEVIEPFRPSIN